MHTYSVTKGIWTLPNENIIKGYSGGNCGNVPEAINNPLYTNQPNIGPIPIGYIL